MVERLIAWPTRSDRKVRHRGVAHDDRWLHHRAAAIDLRRLITSNFLEDADVRFQCFIQRG